MSKTFSDFLRHDQRLVLLRLLAEMPSYRANSSVLAIALERYGHAMTRDQVKTELRWLEEQGLLSIEDLDTVLVATLRERGQDVATGRTTVPGVKRPGAA
ncbi:VpaChn25_0724 family phage protein [Achromobacter anxifer]|uniref:VpaChn25_0724 family phage protein n=1 Tax=Achromobacter insolitus TaxID=217204 RepID=UPI0028B17772|nr:ArsR family transcriptional regulator [Achromobacter insolitus]